MRLLWIRRRGLSAATAATIALVGTSGAVAQFAPSGDGYPGYAPSQPHAQSDHQTPRYTAGTQDYPSNNSGYGAEADRYASSSSSYGTVDQGNASSPEYSALPRYGGQQSEQQSYSQHYGQQQIGTPDYRQQQVTTSTGSYNPYTAYPQSSAQYGPQYVASARSQSESESGGSDLPLNQPGETIPPGQPQQNGQQSYSMDPYSSGGYGDYPPQPAPHQHLDVPNYESYPGNSYGTGSCGPYDTFSGGGGYGYGYDYGHGRLRGDRHGGHCATGDCAAGACCDLGACGPRRQWFGGVYGLLMERVGCDFKPLAFRTTDRMPGYYYPDDPEIIVTNGDIDNDFQGGAEVRFGSTLLCGMRDPCGTMACSPRWAWEVAYWGLAEDTTTFSVYDDMPMIGDRIGSLIDYRGLEIDYGDGYRPVNDYWGYANGDTDIGIRELHYRNTFSAQSLELNLLRLPNLVSCDPCGGRPRYQVTTSAGIRFLRFDDDFWSRSDFTWYDAGNNPLDDGYMAYNLEVDNQLVGFQLGANGIYHFGHSGKCAIYCNSTAGIYGNDIEVDRWMDSEGMTRYTNWDQDEFGSSSSDTNVAFVGEMRLGASYQYSCNWRVYGGWRVLGVSGVALSTEQHPSAFNTPEQTAGINCHGSLFLHGLQTGVECTY